MSIYAKEFLAIFFAFKEFGHIFWGTLKLVIILTDNKSVNRFFFQTKIIPPTLWNACDYVIQFNFTIAHIPGKNKTAAEFVTPRSLSKRKLILRIWEDILTTPIELNVQSAGVIEEDQILFTDDNEETEEQIWQQKKDARSHSTNQVPDISLE